MNGMNNVLRRSMPLVSKGIRHEPFVWDLSMNITTSMIWAPYLVECTNVLEESSAAIIMVDLYLPIYIYYIHQGCQQIIVLVNYVLINKKENNILSLKLEQRKQTISNIYV
jgi:hypothetical protein